MKRRRSQETVPTGTITVRMPTEKIARLKREAEGALTSTSAYVEALLDADEPELCPSLAALARLVAIHEFVASTEVITSEQLRELELLVLQLAKAAHRETDALA